MADGTKVSSFPVYKLDTGRPRLARFQLARSSIEHYLEIVLIVRIPDLAQFFNSNLMHFGQFSILFSKALSCTAREYWTVTVKYFLFIFFLVKITQMIKSKIINIKYQGHKHCF